MAFKMKNGGSAFPYGNSPLKDKQSKQHTHAGEEELDVWDKNWEDLTEEEKKQREIHDEQIRLYNISEEEKRLSAVADKEQENE